MSTNLRALRRALVAYLAELGASPSFSERIHLVTVKSKTDDDPIPIPFFPLPQMSDIERAIINAIEAAGGPLQQKQIADGADIGIRTVQRTTPAMVARGLLIHHPTQGFYVPGMAPPKDE